MFNTINRFVEYRDTIHPEEIGRCNGLLLNALCSALTIGLALPALSEEPITKEIWPEVSELGGFDDGKALVPPDGVAAGPSSTVTDLDDPAASITDQLESPQPNNYSELPPEASPEWPSVEEFSAPSTRPEKRRPEAGGIPEKPSEPAWSSDSDIPKATPAAFFSSPDVTVGAEAGVTWDDNIFIQESSPESDVIYHVSSMLRIRSGDFSDAYDSHVNASYQPTYYLFSEHTSESGLDHDANAEVQHSWGRLTAGADVAYRKERGGSPDFGNRVESRDFEAEAMAAYAVGGRTRAEFTAAYTSERYDSDLAIDSEDVSARLFADYEASAKTHIAAGAAIGRLDTEGSSEQDYRQALVRVRSQISPKWLLHAEGGADQRDAGDGGGETTPVFEIGLRGESRSATLDLDASRQIHPSASLGGQNYISTRMGLRGSQRVSDRFKLTLDSGIEWLDYSGREGGVSAARSDTYYFLRPGLRYEFDRFHADLFYEFLDNSSNRADSSYEVNRAGLALGAEF